MCSRFQACFLESSAAGDFVLDDMGPIMPLQHSGSRGNNGERMANGAGVGASETEIESERAKVKLKRVSERRLSR